MISLRNILGNSIKSGLLFAVCLIGMILVGADVSGRSFIIDSLPYTIDSDGLSPTNPDTYYVAGTNLSSTTNGIFINANFICLDLQGDTITFGTGGGSGNRGLYISKGTGYPSSPMANFVTVKNGWIIHDGDGENNIGIDIYYAKNVLIDRVNVIVMAGTDPEDDQGGHCIAGSGFESGIHTGAYNIEIKGCTLWNNVTQYERRDYNLASAIKFVNGWKQDSSDYEYTWKVHDVDVMNGPHTGILMSGWGSVPPDSAPVVYIYDCLVRLDARNDLYPSYPAGNYHGTTNPYSIGVSHIGGGSQIHNNTIRSGTSHAGSRGLYMDRCYGLPDNHILVHDNDINYHEGPNTEYGPQSPFGAFGIRMRYGFRFVDLYNNAVVCSTDSDNDMDDRHWAANVFYFTSGEGNWGVARDVYVYNNTFSLITNGDSSACAAAFELNMDSTEANRTNIFENNRFESNSDLIYMGSVNRGCAHLRLNGGTLVRTSPSQADALTYRVGYYISTSTDNILRDMNYEGGAAEDDFIWYGGPSVDADLSFQRTLVINVIGNNSYPVPGATVRAVNGYDDTVLVATTDGGGRASGPVTYLYESRYGSDSTSFNDFLLTAEKDGESNSISFTVSNTSGEAIIPLAVEGDSTRYSLNINTDGCGSVNVDPDSQEFLYGSEVELTAVPCDSQWVFTRWSHGSTVNPDTITITSDTTVTAFFQDILTGLFTLTINVAGCGSVNVDPDSSQYHYGTQVTLTAEPCNDWTFSNWSGDLSGNTNPATITMTGDLGVVGHFENSVDIQGPTVNDMEYPTEGRHNVFSSRPVFSVRHIPDIPIIYFQVDDNTWFDSPVESGPVPTADGASTTWTIPEPIMEDSVYYWRISADNVIWTAPISFSAQLEIHSYPNPFRTSAGHTSITFTNLPAESRLTIFTLSGSKILQEGNLGPGEWTWNVSGEPWKDLASGVYLYSVEFNGNVEQGKVMIIR